MWLRTLWPALAAAAFAVAPLTGASAAPKRLLLVTHTAGFRHEEGIKAGDSTLAEIGQVSKLFTVDFCRTADDVKAMLTVEALKKYDGVVFNNTTGDLGIPDLEGFLAWIKSGKAFIGMHAATDTYHGNAAYLDMIADEFVTHAAQATVQPVVDDPKHPATVKWDPSTRILDEIYEFKHNDRTKVHALLSMDKHPDDGHPNAGKPTDMLLAWCKEYGKGRVFYTGLGHRGDVWTNETYRQHLLGGIRWALGLAKGSAKPGTAAK
jgi:type 1 glutamine amidotransferase